MLAAAARRAVYGQPFKTLHAVGNWIYYFFGFVGTGVHYAFWSGTGSDIGEIVLVPTIIFGLWHWCRHVNCHDGGKFPHGCLRLLTFKVEGLPYRMCHKHHPVLSQRLHHEVTAEIVAIEHRLHLNKLYGITEKVLGDDEERAAEDVPAESA